MTLIEAKFYLPRQNFDLDLAFTLEPGRICALFGPSGAGKTSVLRALAGLEPQCRGSLQVGTQCWQDARHSWPTHQRPLGYVFQEASLLAHLSVLGNLEYGWRRTPSAQRCSNPEEMAARLGISHLLARQVAQLSGGERQKVAIARALLTAPQLLLMDEALASLDSASKQTIVPFLKQIQQQTRLPVLYITHALDEVMQLADDIILLDQGKMLAQGALPAILTRFDLPLAHLDHAESLVSATVLAHEAAYHLLHLESDFGPLQMVHGPLAPGQRVKIRIRAKDVSISRDSTQESSILNRLPIEIVQMDADQPGSVLLLLHNPRQPESQMLARISAKSSHTLGLAPGQRVFAQCKGVALAP
ncbi:MAG: hypothetical protein RL748_4215 [Pseudomonadota bacterium]|jgi:molybdate transport system ATP-binding protein